MNVITNQEAFELINQKSKLETYCSSLADELNSVSMSYIKVGFYLYKMKQDINFADIGYKDVYEFASEHFGLGSTSVKNMIGVVGKFCEEPDKYGYPALKEEFKDFKYTQLVELVPVSNEQLAIFTKDMTIKEIRESKKQLSLDEWLGQNETEFINKCETLIKEYLTKPYNLIPDDEDEDDLDEDNYETKTNNDSSKIINMFVDSDVTFNRVDESTILNPFKFCLKYIIKFKEYKKYPITFTADLSLASDNELKTSFVLEAPYKSPYYQYTRAAFYDFEDYKSMYAFFKEYVHHIEYCNKYDKDETASKKKNKKIEEKNKELSELFYSKFKEPGVYRYCDVKDIFDQFDFLKVKIKEYKKIFELKKVEDSTVFYVEPYPKYNDYSYQNSSVYVMIYGYFIRLTVYNDVTFLFSNVYKLKNDKLSKCYLKIKPEVIIDILKSQKEDVQDDK